jgi:hypothetical protein
MTAANAEWTFNADQSMLFITAKGQTAPTMYYLERADWSDEISVGYYVHNTDNRERYLIHLARTPFRVEIRCSCRGHVRHGHCKHHDAVNGLIGEGRIDGPALLPVCHPAAAEIFEKSFRPDLTTCQARRNVGVDLWHSAIRLNPPTKETR